ncbi:hemicentin-1-like [Chelonus insularis]|uniref:hemicentin-1-like n=1 Tax=Chelonus insularis TaxID=460826 RepID=UPI00158E3067|nr:hemicentin-1-like [Chelonus insularis]
MKMLLIMSVLALVDAENIIGNVDEPIPLQQVIGVAGHKTRLPCNISLPHRSDIVVTILWYRETIERHPIFSVDARGSGLQHGARHWSDQEWFGDRASMRVDTELVELEVDPLISTDAGVYKCRVDFRDSPTKNQKINLTVIVPPQKPSIFVGQERIYTKTLQPINEDSTLTLVCEVIGGSPPPRVSWYLSDKMLEDSYKRENDDTTISRLDIERVTRSFMKSKLTCRASNTHLIPPVNESIILDMNLKPLEVNITNKSNYVSALQLYEIECITSGSKPEAVITWWKGSHQVKHMAKKFADTPNVTRSVLSYAAIIEDDGKYLMCRAENPLVPDSAVEDKWKLIVHYVPVVSIKLGSSLRANDINEGDDVYFECEVKANPKAYKLSWYKDGKELHQNVSAGIILPGGQSLVLQSVSRASAGEYACTAVNSEGSATSKPVTLEIMYAPICKDGSLAQVVGALKHETISLVCGVQAKPPPESFHWTFNNSGELMSMPPDRFGPVKPLKRITNQWHGSRLNYTLDSDTDYGTVSCWARNRIGVQRTPCLFQIIVAGRPYPLQNCSAAQSTSPYGYHTSSENLKSVDPGDTEWLIVRCFEGFDGGLPLTSYELEVYNEENVHHISTIYLNRSEKILTSQQGPVFDVPNLEPGRNYRLLLYAVNAKGKSDPVVLESITLKGVAMYTTGRGSDKTDDYSLLVACFAGGITAVCILVVGITLTLYRRNHPMPPIKTQTHVVHCEDKDNHGNQTLSTFGKDVECKSVKDVSKPISHLTKDIKKGILETDENPDLIPNKLEKRPEIRFNATYSLKAEETKDFDDHLEDLDYPSPATVLHGKDTWIYPNSYVDRSDVINPTRPSTLPVHRVHDIYTKSLRVQESCI